MTEPILTYPDPNHPYVLFTDASKYAWACVLTQEKIHQIERKEVKNPTSYNIFEWSLSWKSNELGLFNQKSLCHIHVHQKTSILYRRCRYHPKKLPFTSEKFLAKNTLNSKVNNWAIEISPFCITFEFIKGIKNTLADTMSRLITIDPQIQQEAEPEGYEFG